MCEFTISDSIGDPRTLEDGERQFHNKDDGELKVRLSIDNSMAAHIRWRNQYVQNFLQGTPCHALLLPYH